MTTGHIFFIPMVLLVGLVLGILIGRRSVEAESAEQERLARRRAARREEKSAADKPEPAGAAEES